MMQRSAANRAALKARREQAAHIRKVYSVRVARSGELVDKPLAPEELARIKTEIRQTMRRERRRAVWRVLLVWIILAGAVVGGMIFLLNRAGGFRF